MTEPTPDTPLTIPAPAETPTPTPADPSASEGDRRPVVQHGKLPHRRPWGTLARVVAGVLAVAVVSTASVGAIAAASLSSAVQTVHLGGTGTANHTGVSAFKGAVNFVIVGSDSRNGQSEAVNEGNPGTTNNDVTILVHVSADHRQMTAVSIPRDLVTQLPACRDTDDGQTSPAERGMFNEALGRGGNQGGLQCVANAVENLTGIQPEFAGIFKFDGVAAMSDAIGGVTVCVAKPIHDSYVGLDLPAGEQTIEGKDASRFLRSRHGVGDGSDLARISNQQLFLSALARKVTAPGGALSNPVTMYKLARAALTNMIVSDNLDNVQTLVSLASTLKGMNTSNMLFVQYPTAADPANVNREVVIPGAAHDLNVALQHDTKTDLAHSSTGLGTSAGRSTAKPGASAAPTAGAPSDSRSTVAPSGAGDPSGALPTRTSVPLPSSITGQTANEATCALGNG